MTSNTHVAPLTHMPLLIGLLVGAGDTHVSYPAPSSHSDVKLSTPPHFLSTAISVTILLLPPPPVNLPTPFPSPLPFPLLKSSTFPTSSGFPAFSSHLDRYRDALPGSLAFPVADHFSAIFASTSTTLVLLLTDNSLASRSQTINPRLCGIPLVQPSSANILFPANPIHPSSTNCILQR